MVDASISNLLPINVILSNLEPLLAMPGANTDVLINAPAWLRSYGPDDVEGFLSRYFTGDDYNRWYRDVTSRVTEKRGNLLNVLGSHFIMEALFFSPDDYVRRLVIWLFEGTPNCRSLAEWVELLLKGVVNIVYDQRVFDTKQPPLRSEMTAPTPSSTA